MKQRDKSYFDVHTWLRNTFGKASVCENIRCMKQPRKFDWALIKGKSYEKSRENFMTLCRSCHESYDKGDSFGMIFDKSKVKYDMIAEVGRFL